MSHPIYHRYQLPLININYKESYAVYDSSNFHSLPYDYKDNLIFRVAHYLQTLVCPGRLYPLQGIPVIIGIANATNAEVFNIPKNSQGELHGTVLLRDQRTKELMGEINFVANRLHGQSFIGQYKLTAHYGRITEIYDSYPDDLYCGRLETDICLMNSMYATVRYDLTGRCYSITVKQAEGVTMTLSFKDGFVHGLCTWQYPNGSFKRYNVISDGIYKIWPLSFTNFSYPKIFTDACWIYDNCGRLTTSYYSHRGRLEGLKHTFIYPQSPQEREILKWPKAPITIKGKAYYSEILLQTLPKYIVCTEFYINGERVSTSIGIANMKAKISKLFGRSLMDDLISIIMDY